MRKILKRLLIFFLILAAVPALIACQMLALEHVWPKVAEHNAEKYLRENFPGNDFVIERADYDFKAGGIFVKVQSRSSRDTLFDLKYDAFGMELKIDTYSYVTDGTTTLWRLVDDYRSSVINALERVGEEKRHSYAWIDKLSEREPHGIDPATLELDREYDIAQIGSAHGHVDYQARMPMQEISYERAAELLLMVDRRLKDAGVGYALLDLRLVDPDAWENDIEGYESLVITDISPADVHYEDLPARLKELHDHQRPMEKEPSIE